jgi:hypothetical protein
MAAHLRSDQRRVCHGAGGLRKRAWQESADGIMIASFAIRQLKTVIRSPSTGSQEGQDRSIFARA